MYLTPNNKPEVDTDNISIDCAKYENTLNNRVKTVTVCLFVPIETNERILFFHNIASLQYYDYDDDDGSQYH